MYPSNLTISEIDARASIRMQFKLRAFATDLKEICFPDSEDQSLAILFFLQIARAENFPSELIDEATDLYFAPTGA